MMIANLLRLNWNMPVIPRKWLRFLYRSEILESNEVISLPFECDFFGMRYSGDINNVIDFHCFFYGAFEKGQLFFWNDVADSLFNNKGVYIDIGANVGQHSLFMSKRSPVVHAFEPYEPVREKIAEKIRLNGLTNLIGHDVGIGDKDEIMRFYEPTGANHGIGTFVEEQNHSGQGRELLLPVVAGDEYFYSKIPDEVHMVKIDVEGFEKHVIKGLNNIIKKHRPVIVFELGTGLDCSFSSSSEITDSFPSEYMFFVFDIWDKDGNKDKLKDGIIRKKGSYRLAHFNFDLLKEQADVIAFPCERFEQFSKRFPDKFC